MLDTIGPYRIVAKLGEGGMGEVYRAHDVRLQRDVAIKVLPAAVVQDPERRARFEREAHVLAALNHPHIAQIYGVEPAGDGEALVMELVDGRTLAEILEAGAMPLDEATDIARQIAEGLEAAHAAGIVHRDLKPANIKVRPDGTVKVLDFGLAKPSAAPLASGGSAALDNSPTVTSPALTEQGVILGTVSYMSPEQARGRAVDRRADTWAFGCVLYEMVTGRRAFSGGSVTDVLAAVINTEPDYTAVPPPVRSLVQACLQKDPKRRLHAAADAMLLITPSASGSAPRTRVVWLAGIGVAVSALAVAAITVAFGARAPALRPAMHFDWRLAEGLGGFGVSPDGRFVLFSSQRPGEAAYLSLRSVETGDVRRLPATDGVTAAFWMSDSRAVGFTAGGALKRIAVTGGVPDVLATRDMTGRGCQGPDGFIVMNIAGGMSRVPLAGGDPVAVTTVDRARGELHHEQPACLPDGRFLYYRHMNELASSAIYLGDPSKPPTEQRLEPIVVGTDGPVFVPGSKTKQWDLLFMLDQALYVQPFDVDRAELVGERFRLVDAVGSSTGSGYFSASATGLLAYADPPALTRQLTWIDRNGTVGDSVGPTFRALRGLRLPPTGGLAAVTMFPQDTPVNNDDIWTLALGNGALTRLTSNSWVETSPVWSSDGTKIAYASFLGSDPGLYIRPADGGTSKLVAAVPGTPSDWSPDGRFIVLSVTQAAAARAAQRGGGGGTDIWAVDVAAASATAIPLVNTPANESNAVFSPDGHWIAYLSNETGRVEVHVRRFEVRADGTPTSPESDHRMVSAGARGMVRWRNAGRELLYMSADGKLMSIGVTTSGKLTVTPPRAVFTFPVEYLRANTTGVGIADITMDGSRVLAAMPPAAGTQPSIHVIVNWREHARPVSTQ